MHCFLCVYCIINYRNKTPAYACKIYFPAVVLMWN